MIRTIRSAPRPLRRLGGEEGQVLPLLLVLVVAILAVGLMLFQVGRAADLRSTAQTAADAAALAAAENMKDQLQVQADDDGGATLTTLDEEQMRQAASDYAQRNGGRLRELDRDGFVVRVEVETAERLGESARDLGEEAEEERGSAEARAALELSGGLWGPPGSSGAVLGKGNGKIPDEDWKELDKKLEKPPGVNDLFELGKFLVDHGFAVGEHVAFGGICSNGCHVDGSYHYRSGGRGALDVNFAQTGPVEMAAIDPIVGPVQNRGFRTIWRTTGHYDHIHIDISASGNLGLGGPAGMFALEEALAEVRLVGDDYGISSFGPYAIPTYIVECESGGNYQALNRESGAGGAYQILPSTWRAYGGEGLPHEAPPQEQDRIAALIWANDGPGAWVCA